MQRFKNILVGVDLSQGDRFVSTELPPPTVEAVERALWLAKLNAAHVTFFYAIDVSAAAQRLIEKSAGDEPTLIDKAKDVLHELVVRFTADGVEADLDVRFGKSWIEIIRRVLTNEHDLVVVGTRHFGALQGYLLGSTGIKLLRKCPCPVWITQPQPKKKIQSVLVAHCLRPVGDMALELGCSMAQLHNAELHVLHSLEIPEMECTLPMRVSAEKMAEYRSTAEKHIKSQLTNYEFAHSPRLQIVTDAPDLAVLKHIEKYATELLVMGTVARTGITGFITGNTAERLLPQIPCSVLAVKPSGFVSPLVV